MSTLTDVRRELATLGDATIAAHSQRFFRTGPGEYGEGDRFRGIRVPVLRKIARRHRELSVRDALELLRSPWHEDRLTALLIMVLRYERGDEAERRLVFDAYLDHAQQVNNWDLVDSSAHKIVGPHLEKRSRRVLRRLARSASLWERRIAIIATLHFIKNGEFEDTLQIAETLLADEHDLIHKAVGWMLREVGNRDRDTEERFLRVHYRAMPRTMLRYAIERFPEPLRLAYLHGDIR